MKKELENILENAKKKIESANSLDLLKDAEVHFLGKKGVVTDLMKTLKDKSIEEKRELGPAFNSLKKELESLISKKRQELTLLELNKKLEKESIDVTLPGKKQKVGHLNPISATIHEIEDIFSSMGFTVMDGPHIETEKYNFEDLNIPKHHPARDMTDTFFLEKETHSEYGEYVLRTHTSPTQSRGLRKYGAPLRIIAPGRTFRNEDLDASHEHTFHQVEGMLIDENISLANLKGVMLEFLKRLFGQEVNVRFRPGYFPFVEPGVELDFSCLLCGGSGCKTCKYTGWIEFMGAGMTHPYVLRAGGVDPEKYQGWAFGFGIERLVMMRYGIKDVRLFQSNDLRFVKQF